MFQYITSESVTSGHPDKICDQISDAILDECLKQDPYSRVGCECLAANQNLVIAGEITTKAKVDYMQIAKQTVKDIGYDSDEKYYNYQNVNILNFIHIQSRDIAQGVDMGGAGDQGIMYGYATNETKEFMPLPIDMAHNLGRKLEEVRRSGEIDYIYPDGKTQVTIIYDENFKAVGVDTILISTQHALGVDQNILKQDLIKKVISPVLVYFGYDVKDVKNIYTNPTGVFNIGGPTGDAGLTGRKIIVDTYGGVGRHGGGAFSGKDPTKVDRSGAYIARYLAKNIVASGICDRCEIQLSYAIGIANPISIYVECFGTNKLPVENIINAVRENFDLSPNGIITKLDLRKPIYKKTATYGHFGKKGFTWENLDSVEVFRKLL
ncbi:MAG: methionine adenosyltransferase [Candidatus Gracilibacteria bacterium]|nr:methionine adenosyltransferase [Candidatus Gracilibacteria bacterium]